MTRRQSSRKAVVHRRSPSETKSFLGTDAMPDGVQAILLVKFFLQRTDVKELNMLLELSYVPQVRRPGVARTGEARRHMAVVVWGELNRLDQLGQRSVFFRLGGGVTFDQGW